MQTYSSQGYSLLWSNAHETEFIELLTMMQKNKIKIKYKNYGNDLVDCDVARGAVCFFAWLLLQFYVKHVIFNWMNIINLLGIS